MVAVIDADTHVAESQPMWELIEPAMRARRPVLLQAPIDTLYRNHNAFWLIDGKIMPRPAGKGGYRLITPSEAAVQLARTDITQACREITDVPARLAEMDRYGIAVQVVYPTLFLHYITDDPVLESALCWAYNRWLGQAWAQSANRLRWVVVPPLRDVEASLEQLRWGKENGAVGVFFRGIERDRTLDDPYFFPIYEEAQRLDLPICIHTGAGCPTWTAIFDIDRNTSFPGVRLLPLIAFRDLVANKIPERFPTLRFGFVEAGASWVPYLFHTLRRFFRVDDGRWGPSLFRDYRLYVACEADEDIPYLAEHTGEDHLMIGSDYGHPDPSEEPELVAAIRGREDLTPIVTDKILSANPARFYAL
jgi:predicted TIM-barrel fold metal-dependent hydrolase